jgi:putrescine aminotransferase
MLHSTTFGGNPLACAAGIAAIAVTLEEDLPGQAASKGSFVLRELQELQRKYPEILSEVRGLGLLLGLQFTSTSVGYQCAAALFRRGVLVGGTYSNARTIRIEPPLGISSELLSEVLNRLESCLHDIRSSSKATPSAAAVC